MVIDGRKARPANDFAAMRPYLEQMIDPSLYI
jgi:hypothetical protein